MNTGARIARTLRMVHGLSTTTAPNAAIASRTACSGSASANGARDGRDGSPLEVTTPDGPA